MRAPALAAALLFALACGGPASADDVDDLLGGFDDEETAVDSGDDALGGFDDADDDLGGFEDGDDDLGGFEDADDDLGGFDDAEPAGVRGDGEGSSWLRRSFWEITGSLSMQSVVAYLDHRSVAGNTNYQGLTRLRTRANIQIDLDLPWDLEFRGAAFAFYDWAYLINGRKEYTSDVRRKYEWEIDTQDVWLRGTLLDSIDFKIGRQVVNWGRSETLRVLDIINPLDNRVPGIADIEDLRRTVGMGRFDYYLGDWNLSVLAIPEIRFDQNPVAGSDFSPVGNPLFPAFPALKSAERKPDSFDNWEVGVGITGIFSGWDASAHVAYYYDDLATLRSTTPVLVRNVPTLVLEHKRLVLVGGGANYTLGSFLFKGELAYIDGVALTDQPDQSRLDALFGVEYYGLADTTLVVEAAHRHIIDFPGAISVGTNFFVVQENATEVAIRLTRSFLREKLDATALAVLFFGDSDGPGNDPGAVMRFDASYELAEALVATAGIVIYEEGDVPPLSTWGDNDRIFFELKWSF